MSEIFTLHKYFKFLSAIYLKSDSLGMSNMMRYIFGPVMKTTITVITKTFRKEVYGTSVVRVFLLNNNQNYLI